MTHEEQALADDKMRAEIAKLLAETRQIGVNTFLAPALAGRGAHGRNSGGGEALLLMTGGRTA